MPCDMMTLAVKLKEVSPTFKDGSSTCVKTIQTGTFSKTTRSCRLLFLSGAMILISCFQWSATGRAATASWYSTEQCNFNPDPACPTASGKSLYQLEKDNVDFAASYGFALGSRVKVTNLRNGKSVVVRIYDRGPNKRFVREIDLGKKSFNWISDTRQGLIPVSLEVVS